MNAAESPATELCIVLTTASSEAVVRRLIDRALETRLAACIQVLPITSHYVWKGEICREGESLLLFKSKGADYAALEALIRAEHDYETPEILKLNVAEASRAYLDWVLASTR
jgi:periplasmic divalent cation tolerance protein